MCGIAGLIAPAPSDAVAARVSAMTDALRHRGPDDAGCLVRRAGDLAVGLGHRRLSIIDLSPAGHQPMQAPSGRDVWIIFNGEIYNYLDLRAQLSALGVRFRSNTDTEAIVAAYEAWGAAGMARLDGMFALAIWDGERRTLLLARDRLGKKPLCYWQAGRTFAFASELVGLTALPELPRGLDPQALAGYFTLGYVPGERSILSAVRKLPPGCTAEWSADRLTVRRYWSALDAVDPPRDVVAADASDAALIDELDRRLAAATRRRLMSDVPLGAWLSGGVDSTLVVAEMVAAATGPVRTFTIGFDDAQRDESAAARAVAQHLGTEHSEFHVSAREMRELIPQAAGVFDEPFADDAGIPTFALSRMSRRHVTVALAGDGGDEGFMGYSHYRRGRMHAWIDRLPLALRRGAASLAALPGPTRWRQRLAALGYADWAELYVTITSTLRTTSAGRVYAAPFVLDGSVFREVAQRLHGREPETLLALLDSTTTLTDKFLVKSDRAAMAASLEVRAPFLDHRLLEWAWALPRRYKLRGGVTKFLLRELVYRKVPRALVDRPKQGFSPPIETWLRGGLSDWVRETLAPRRVAATGVLNAPAVGRVVDRHLLDKAPLGQAVWTLLCFMTWHDRFMSPAAAPLPALRVAPERVA